MKRILWIGGVLLIILLVGGTYIIRNSSNSSNNDQVGGTSEMSSTITITSSDNGRTLTYPVGYELTLKSDLPGSALDISGYDEKVIAQLGSTEQYQLQRTLKMLKLGQTELAVILTPGCAIPKEGQVRCLVTSQQILLTIVVK